MSVSTTNTNSVIEGYENLSSPLDYFRLMKPRVMSLVVFTAFVGYYVSTPESGYYLNPFFSFYRYIGYSAWCWRIWCAQPMV